jgi:probable phosphoglycerate mutase
MEKDNYCTLYVVRHGETEWNIGRILQGQSDSPLTKAGVEQIHRTAKELADINFDAIFSSDSPRAHRTAEVIKLERDLVIQTTELLRERSYGHFDGKPFEEYIEATQELQEKLNKLPEEEQWEFKFGENIESDFELVSRFITKLREISVAYPNKTVLVTTHGGCITMFLRRIGYFTKEQLPMGSFGNAGYVKVLSDGVDFFVKDVKGVKEKPRGEE